MAVVMVGRLDSVDKNADRWVNSKLSIADILELSCSNKVNVGLERSDFFSRRKGADISRDHLWLRVIHSQAPSLVSIKAGERKKRQKKKEREQS